MRVTLPLKLVSVANRREHWSVRARRARAHRQAAIVVPRPDFAPPYTVTITRIGPRRLDDDNLASAAKALRDGIADRLGMDDGDSRISWRYRQDHGDYGAVVEIFPRMVVDSGAG